MRSAQHDTMHRVKDVCADPAERLALSIIRFLAAGYSTGDVAAALPARAGVRPGPARHLH